jgi:hypothetical protein
MPDPSVTEPSPTLTREQAILIASRILAAYLLFWIIVDLTYIPHELLAVARYMKVTGSVLGTNTSLPQTSYYLRYYMLVFIENVLHIALWLTAANWFYRCGPRIRNFFAAPTSEPNPSP